MERHPCKASKRNLQFGKGAVVVKANCHSQGIGKTMVKEALKISAAAGCYKATLSSNLKRDRAHAFITGNFHTAGVSVLSGLKPDVICSVRRQPRWHNRTKAPITKPTPCAQ